MTMISKIFIELSSCFKGGPAAENGMEIGTEKDYCFECMQDIVNSVIENPPSQEQIWGWGG